MTYQEAWRILQPIITELDYKFQCEPNDPITHTYILRDLHSHLDQCVAQGCCDPREIYNIQVQIDETDHHKFKIILMDKKHSSKRLT